eukprot:CAMPEP_0177756740 /NCGR_PEP_ID=MMETSP0491_2-20121128/3269_1 /TAXON_ID=63592 /ORGANISM="Tetraselmis chuii, Strain PLY429" /LENGTH=93 /DNA_ID=CAMNT_0019272341 /DNA_START=369 /DNA_END=649 /DNA_ORIENTATION=+
MSSNASGVKVVRLRQLTKNGPVQAVYVDPPDRVVRIWTRLPYESQHGLAVECTMDMHVVHIIFYRRNVCGSMEALGQRVVAGAFGVDARCGAG